MNLSSKNTLDISCFDFSDFEDDNLNFKNELQNKIHSAWGSLYTTDVEKITNFVTSFLHPYITGQINKTAAATRKPLMISLFEQIPTLTSLNKESVTAIALKAYISSAAKGLYIYKYGHLKRKKHRPKNIKIIKPKSKYINIIVNSLKESLPIDFPQFKFAPSDLPQLAKTTLETINIERIRGDFDAKCIYRSKDANDRYLKLFKLQQSNLSFFTSPHDAKALPITPLVESEAFQLLKLLEIEAVTLISAPNLNSLKTLETNISHLDSQVPHNHLNDRISIFNLVLSVTKKFMNFDFSNTEYKPEDLNQVKEDLVKSYNEFISQNIVSSNFSFYIKNILNLLTLIENLNQYKGILKYQGLWSNSISSAIAEIEERNWYTLIYTNPDDNNEHINQSTLGQFERFKILLEVANLIKLQSNFLKNSDFKSQIIQLMEVCLIDEKIPTHEILIKFQDIFE